MAKVERVSYVCDRCHREDIQPTYQQRETWTKIERDISAHSYYRHLLCSVCARDLLKWMKEGLPKVVAHSNGGPYR